MLKLLVKVWTTSLEPTNYNSLNDYKTCSNVFFSPKSTIILRLIHLIWPYSICIGSFSIWCSCLPYALYKYDLTIHYVNVKIGSYCAIKVIANIGIK